MWAADAIATVAAADGHGRSIAWREALPSMLDDGAPPRWHSFIWPFVGQATTDGVHGRDF